MVDQSRQSIDVYIIVSKLVPETAQNITALLSTAEVARISLLWNGIGQLDIKPFLDPKIRHTHSSKRLPVARARNTLLQAHPPQADLVFWMDEDAYIDTHEFEKLFMFLETHPQAGVIGLTLIYPDGTRQESARLFQTPWILALRTFSRLTNYKFSSVEKSLFPISDITKVQEVDWLLGASHLYRRSIFEKVGLYNESYHRVYDDVAFAFAVRKAGYTNYYAPFARIVHAYSKSSQRLFSRDFFRHLCDASYFFLTCWPWLLKTSSSRRSSRT